MLLGDDRSKSRVPVSELVKEFALRRIGSAVGYGCGAIAEPLHLGVGCRRPAKVLVLDTDTGTPVAELDSPGDADDIFLDPAQNRVYVSGGEGFARVYARREVDHFEVIGDLRTGPGARTSLLAAESQRLYVAVPRRGEASAEILVFETTK